MKKFLILFVLLIAFATGAIFLWLNNTAPTYSGSAQFQKINELIRKDFFNQYRPVNQLA